MHRNQFNSYQLIALDELCLSCDRYVSEVENFPEERFAGRPLYYLFFREEQKAAGERHQEDQLEQVDPSPMQNDLDEGLLRLPRRFLSRLVGLWLLFTVLLIVHALVLVARIVSAIFFSFLRDLSACHRLYTTSDGLDRLLAARIELVPGLWSKERREAADAHDERQREKAELVASWRGAWIALEDEGDLALFL